MYIMLLSAKLYNVVTIKVTSIFLNVGIYSWIPKFVHDYTNLKVPVVVV